MIYNWTKNIVIYLILSGIVINVTPSSNYKKYINFLSGLIVIIILAEPLTYIFRLSSGDISKLYDEASIFINENTVSMEYEEMDTYSYYDMSMNEAIMSYLHGAGFQVEEVSVITDSDNNITDCIIMSQEPKEREIEIKNIISEVYNIKIDSIYIVRR